MQTKIITFLQKICQKRLKYFSLILILLVAFSVRLFIFTEMVGDSDKFLQGDSALYQKLAVNLIEFGYFGDVDDGGNRMPEMLRLPFYPGFLAIVYKGLGLRPAAAILVQIVLSMLTIAVVYKIGCLWGGHCIGLGLATLISLETLNIFYANQLLTETVFSFNFLTGLMLWSLMLRRRQWQFGLASGLFFGLGAYTRPILLYFGPVIAVLTWLLFVGNKTRRATAALVVFITFLITLTPWLIRNYSVAGQPLFTVNGSIYLQVGVVQLRAYQQNIPYSQAQDELTEELKRETSADVWQDPIKLAAYYEKKLSAEILENWADYSYIHLRGSVLVFLVPSANAVARTVGWLGPSGGTGLLVNIANRSPLETWQAFQIFLEENARQGSGNWLFFGIVGYELIFLGVIYMGAIIGGIKSIRRKQWRLLLFIVTTVGYFALLTGHYGFDARFRLPMMPFIGLLALQALPKITNRLGET